MSLVTWTRMRFGGGRGGWTGCTNDNNGSRQDEALLDVAHRDEFRTF